MSRMPSVKAAEEQSSIKHEENVMEKEKRERKNRGESAESYDCWIVKLFKCLRGFK